jgi:cytochrome oxidase Cu insertion factor (SCO1/SenC/PrrC family)
VILKILAIVSLSFLAQAKDRPQQGAGPEVGKEAPAWKLKTQDGKTEVDLAKLKGKPVFLVFGSYT